MVARGLGVRLSLPTAVAAYYRSVFLNLTLPGGVAGDVHRGVSHGRDVRDVGRALRAVAWERTAGQVVQVVLTVSSSSCCRRPCARPCRSRRARWSRRAVGVVLVDRARVEGGAAPAGRGRGTRWRPTSAPGCFAGRHCRRSRSRRRWSSSAMRSRSSSPRGRRASPRHSPGCCRWRCSRCWPWCCRASPAGGRARARRHGCSPRPASGARSWRRDRRRLRRHGARRQPAGCARARCGVVPSTAVAIAGSRASAGRRAAGRSRGCMTARTPSSPAAYRSTATSATPPRGCCCPTTRTSTGSTPSAPRATRSSSGRRRFGSTTRGSSCGRRLVATSGPPAASRRRR